MKTTICIPTLNMGSQFDAFFKGLQYQNVSVDILVVDSSSKDATVARFRGTVAKVHVIERNEFNHGATRQLAFSLCPDADIIIFTTQDAILASTDSIKNILEPFKDKKVGAVCGRQLPCADASPIAAHARLFNYPTESSIKTKNDIPRMGIKAAFLSNSFAAYRRTALMDVGGFPSDVIFGEDTYVAAKMLLAGWRVAYSADACCFHSHNYSVFGEFKRYFDIGVFLSREKWYINSFGKPEGEGNKFVLSEIKHLAKRAPWLIPSSLVRTGLKFLGYKIGQGEQYIPMWLKRKMSMNKGYWKNSLSTQKIPG